jgi:hypothetical protein
MINFRFHLVSLVAVFLALGLGILVGSTVIDQGIVDRLDREINSVRKENKERKSTNAELAKENKQLQQYIADAAPYVGDGRLEQQSVAIVAENGVDGDVVKQAEKALRDAGADVPAVLSLEDSWRLETDAQVQDLKSALDLTGDATTMRNTALGLLAQRLAEAPGTTTSTTTRTSTSTAGNKTGTTRRTTPTTTPASKIDALTALEQAGFLDVIDGDASAFDTFPSLPANVLVITGDDSHFAGTDLTSSFVRALTQANLPTVLGAAYDPGNDEATAPERGASIAPVLDDQALSRAASTVDDLELVQGRAATVLALQAISGGNLKNIGHYGYGSGASAPLPPHQS